MAADENNLRKGCSSVLKSPRQQSMLWQSRWGLHTKRPPDLHGITVSGDRAPSPFQEAHSNRIHVRVGQFTLGGAEVIGDASLWFPPVLPSACCRDQQRRHASAEQRTPSLLRENFFLTFFHALPTYIFPRGWWGGVINWILICQNSYVEDLIPITSEWDCVWRQGL